MTGTAHPAEHTEPDHDSESHEHPEHGDPGNGVESYISGKKRLPKEIFTREHYLNKAYQHGIETTFDEEGLIDMEKLNAEEGCERFKHAFGHILEEHAARYLKRAEGAEWDEYQRASAEFGVYGVATELFYEALDTLKADFTDKKFRELYQPGLELVIKECLGPVVRNKVKKENASQVLEYVHLTKEEVDTEKITQRELIELIELFLKHGVIPPNAIKDKPYLKIHHPEAQASEEHPAEHLREAA